MAGFALVLFGVTWKLWTPQTEFPQIPFFAALVSTPGVVDWILGAIILAALLGTMISTRSAPMRLLLLAFVFSGIGLVMLNQHRLQPWTYQFLVFGLLIATLQEKSALFWMRWIVISIYIYSAISKFDYQFVRTVGDQMLATLVEFVGQDSSTWPPAVRSWIVIMFPIGELLVGLGLGLPRTRKIAIAMALLLHLLLLLILGPLGLDHRPGVLIWNLYFMAQVVFLFHRIAPEFSANETKHRSGGRERVGSMVALAVIFFPATQSIGLCDHWPAWEVYAPRSSRAEIVSRTAGFEPFSNEQHPVPSQPWSNFSKWSLEKLGVPVYPEARFQLAVAIAVFERQHLDSGYQVVLKSESNRRTGTRTSEVLKGRDQMAMRVRAYWLNTQVRTLWPMQ